ncbi:MAG: hypothetical protein KDE20_26810, partial [Caldilineaceae bacterium]|nr:hypothetical protein [Caldilineaceae bacterium]
CCLAIRTFDTWLLADLSSVTSILSVYLHEDELPDNLESLPFDLGDPLHGKNVFRQLIEQSEFIPNDDRSSERFLTISWFLAHYVDLDVIRSRCPKGFGGFSVGLRSLIERRNGH